MTAKKRQTFDFETALQELTEIVEQMEAGGDSLEVSLKKFEKGILLTRQCQEALQSAQQKVEILLEKNGETTLTDYVEEGED